MLEGPCSHWGRQGTPHSRCCRFPELPAFWACGRVSPGSGSVVTLPPGLQLGEELQVTLRAHPDPWGHLCLSGSLTSSHLQRHFSIWESRSRVPRIRACVSLGPFCILPQTSSMRWAQLGPKFVTPTPTLNSSPELNSLCFREQVTVASDKDALGHPPCTAHRSCKAKPGLRVLAVHRLLTFRRHTEFPRLWNRMTSSASPG